MFLDGELRALAARRRQLRLRGELLRRLARLEVGLARAFVRRSLAEATSGLRLARRVLNLLRGR